jgi:hypothetical protein
LLTGAIIDLNGDVAGLSKYIGITDQGADILLSFDPSGHGTGSAVALLLALGGVRCGFNAMVSQGMMRIAYGGGCPHDGAVGITTDH